ncbi:MAG: cob(I)yrinic acid a,c-diamide adenosyltransferase [Verrucomicrobiota bacterium]
MSIATKTGDKGETGLYYGKRVSKDDQRVEAYGSIDELNSALGVVRSHLLDPLTQEKILNVQNGLVLVMGELAVPIEKLDAYREKYPLEDILKRQAWLDSEISSLEASLPPMTDWSMPGNSKAGAFLDVARTSCRRAERRVVSLKLQNTERNYEAVLRFLNRLSDYFFLLERVEDSKKQ